MSDGTNNVEGERLFRQAWTLLGHLGVHMTPANYELMCEVLLGRKPELRARFKALPRPVSQRHLTELTAQYLPHHGLAEQLLNAGHDTSEAMERLEAEFTEAAAQLSFQLKHLAVMRSRLPNADELRTMSAQDLVIDFEASLDSHAESLRRLAVALEAGQAPVQSLTEMLEKMKEQPLAQAMGAGQGANQVHGLGDGQAMKTRLEEIYQTSGKAANGSLLLCHMAGFDKYNSPHLSKAGGHLTAAVSRRIKGMIEPDESAYWLTSDRLGLLLNTQDERAVTQVGSEISSAVGSAVDGIRQKIPSAPDVSCRFGCATPSGSETAAHFFMTANLALQQAEASGRDRPVFAPEPDKAAGPPRYNIIYGRGAQS